MSQWSAIPVFTYNESLANIFSTDWNNFVDSDFDLTLKNAWNRKMEEGHFRYKLMIQDSKFLAGDCRYLAQLNEDRATNRRAPEEFESVKEPCRPHLFNFTKINCQEFLFRIRGAMNTEDDDSDANYVAINVSPLGVGHCLLLPSLFRKLPQIATGDGLRLAVNLMLISGSPSFRIAFNSLCAYASVNHLHFHLYYLDHQMLLECLEVEHLTGQCYQLPASYPGRGYTFQIRSEDEIQPILRGVMTLIDHFIENNIAHNVYFTRGVRFENSINTSQRDCIRIYVWPRMSSRGAKVLEEFNPAACELFGHLVIKKKEGYDRLTEEFVNGSLRDITEGPFLQTKDTLKLMF